MKTPENQSFSGIFRVMIVNIDGQYFLGTLALNGLKKNCFIVIFKEYVEVFISYLPKNKKR